MPSAFCSLLSALSSLPLYAVALAVADKEIGPTPLGPGQLEIEVDQLFLNILGLSG